MATYVNGVWSFTYPDCPTCNTIRNKQGFSFVVDESKDLCPPCAEQKAYEAYVASPAYQTWLASIPVDATMDWFAANPPPERSS